MTIPAGHATNFDTMLRAAANGHLALLECKDAKTGEPVYTIVMVSMHGNEYEFIPVARMFDGNPYDHVVPPTVEEVTVIDETDTAVDIDDMPPTGSVH